MKITILGAGNMGSAISRVLCDNGHDVRFWSIEPDVVEDINVNSMNSKYLPGVKLKAVAFGGIKEALDSSELVVFAVPSHVVRKVCQIAQGLILKGIPIINLGKGLAPGGKRLSDVFKEYFDNPLVVVGGPCIATELARKVPSFVVFSGESVEVVKSVFDNDYYHVSTSSDVIGVELCSFLKNVVAIIAGIVDGLGFGVNTKAGIITNGLEELSLIARALGAKQETVYGLAGLGDLMVTCFSVHSRNRSFGEFLGQGLSKEEALIKVGQVVEGLGAIGIVMNFIKEHDLDCPLISRLDLFLNEGIKGNLFFKKLFINP